MGKNTIQCFRRAIYYTCVFNMASAGTFKSDCMPFPSRPGGYKKYLKKTRFPEPVFKESVPNCSVKYCLNHI